MEPRVKDEYCTLLKSLGFSDYDALIYLTLIEKPEGENLEKIAELCRIPPIESQKTINKLFSEGLIEITSNIVTAVSPAQALNKVYQKLEKELRARIDSFRSTIFSLQESLESVYWQQRLGISPEEIIEPLKDLTSMELQTSKIISNAEKCVMIFAGSFDWCEKIRGELIKTLNRGVSIRVMMRTTTPDSIKRAKGLIKDGVQVKSYKENWYPTRGTLADGNKLVFLIWATEKDVKKPIHFRPHYTMNPGLITIFSDAFERKWSEARSID